MSSPPPPPPPPSGQRSEAAESMAVEPATSAGGLNASQRGSSTASQSAEETSLVLRRAMELADLADTGIDVALPAHTLVEIAQELDIPLDAVAGALVESRLNIDADSRSILDRLVGPSEIWATRMTPGGEADDDMKERLLSWLEKGHGLKTRERNDGVLVAKKRRGLLGKVGKTVRDARGTGGLAKAGVVEAIVVDLSEDAPGSVGLSVDIGAKRSSAVAAGAALTVGGSALVAVVSLITVPATLVAIPVLAGVGVATSRRLHGATVEHMTDAVEETVDGVIANAEPPSVLGGFLKRSS